MSLREEIEILCNNAKVASQKMALASTEQKNELLLRMATLLEEETDLLVEENRKDLEKAEENRVSKTMLDRLALSPTRILSICQSLRSLIELEDPIGKGETWSRPSGIEISRIRVPIGVVAMIYEARPNVTVDSAALCLKTGNVVILRGGKEAYNSNKCLCEIMRGAIAEVGLPEDAVQFVDDTTREVTTQMMKCSNYLFSTDFNLLCNVTFSNVSLDKFCYIK